MKININLGLLLLLGWTGLGESVQAQPQKAADNTPTIFVCGDSTAKNSGRGKNGEPVLGWGTPIAEFFDPAQVVVKNVGHAGTSSRTYYERDWSKVLPQIRSGDFVLLVFGINDGSTPPGLGEETVERNGQSMHTYGWYMAKMANDAMAQGAHVYLLTVTTRNIWTNPKMKFRDATPTGPLPDDYDPKEDRIERGTGGGRFTRWTKELGEKLHVPVFDLTNFCADQYEALGREAVDKFYSDHNHTYRPGAEFVAASIVAGLKAFHTSPFLPLLSQKGYDVKPAPAPYVHDNTAPVEIVPIEISDIPRHTQMGSPPVPDGAPGRGRYVPPLPADPTLPTLWIIGDSTVRNGTLGDGSNQEQWGWGAPIVAYFDPEKINVVNRAFGGTSSRTFYRGFFWENLRPLIQKGDFVLLQFGANDNGGARGKGALKGTGDETEVVEKNGVTETVHTFGWYLRQFVNETRERGATPILCSLTPREGWTEDGDFRRDDTTHVAWAATVAKQTDAPFVDLYHIIARKYEALGSQHVATLFVPAPRENLHTGWDGAVINADCVIAGLKALKGHPLAPFLSVRAIAVAPVVPVASNSED